MELLTLLVFIVLVLGFGYTATFFIKQKFGLLERLFVMAGIGLGVIPILGVLLNLIRIKLHILVFIILALVIPAYSFYKFVVSGGLSTVFQSFSMKGLKKSTAYLLLAVLFGAILFGVYIKGSFTYPYLEDDDPWLHAAAAKYFGEKYTYSQQVGIDVSHYLEPYPPGFVILMGLLHQTNSDIIWTLKFFNSLLIALGVVFFYLFAREFTKDQKKALFATFVITIIPCFLSHFIWGATLAITLFFPAFYCLERIQDDRNWILPSIIVISGIIVTQMSNALIFGVLFGLYFVIKSVAHRKFLKLVFFAGLLGAVIAFSLFWVPTVAKYGLEETAGRNAINLNDLSSISTKASGGGLLYSWADFVVAHKSSKMDNPVGVGVVLFFLLVFSLLAILLSWIIRPKQILSHENAWRFTCLLWLLLAFAGIHGNRLPFPMLMPHRWWAIFAIPVAFICVEGFFALGRLSEKVKIHRFFIYGALIIGILFTSAYPKYVVETSYWPPGVNWGSMEEVQGYLSYIAPLPYNTKVFTMCSDDFKVLAFDKFAEPWDPEYVSFKNSAINSTPKALSQNLKRTGYEYLVMDAYCVRKYSINETNDKLMEIGNSSYFTFAGGNKAFFMFKVL